jgi:hypothetical protein
LTKTGWAKFWAIFAQTNLVTLLVDNFLEPETDFLTENLSRHFRAQQVVRVDSSVYLLWGTFNKQLH